MGQKVGLFNLPAKATCTPTKWCLEGKNGKPICYALRNNCLLPSVIKATQERFKQSKRKDFTERMIREIKDRFNFFRIHATGDFYSEEYVEKWIKIVQACPNTLFRTTTRRRDLTKALKRLHKEPNVIVRESLDTVRRKPQMNLPVAAITSVGIKKDVIACPNDCDKCNHLCWKKPKNVVFEEH